MARTEHFLFVLLKDFTHLAFANAVEPLRIANMISGQNLYAWSFASDDGAFATASNGVEVRVHHGIREMPNPDYLFVISGVNAQQHSSPALNAALRQARSRGVRLGGLCSGAYALAEAGMLNGQPIAVHWEFHEPMREKYPEIEVTPSVFVADAPVISASGGAATGDLMLHLIGQEHGEDLALAVSEQMVYAAVRTNTAEQKVSLLARHNTRSQRLAQAIRIMRENVENPLPTWEVANQIGVSTRQLERLFAQHLNTSPKRFMMEVRLERARTLLIHTEMSVTEIGLACGFTSSSNFSRVYQKAFGTRPGKQGRILG